MKLSSFHSSKVSQKSSNSSFHSQKVLQRRLSGSQNTNLSTNIDSTFSESPVKSCTILVQSLKKPISLIVLEKYFSDICQSIKTHNSIELSLLKKCETMKEVLKDFVSYLNPDAYIKFSSALKDIQSCIESQDEKTLLNLMKKIGNIALMIQQNRIMNQTERLQTEENPRNDEPEDLGKELEVRVSRVTARVLNIWKKILSPQKEAEIICYCFLLLYSEIDSTIKLLSPDKSIDIMKKYLSNPGYVVTTIRHTKDYIEQELISPGNIKKVFCYLERTNIDRIRGSDRTMAGLVLYELLFYSVMYFAFYYQKHYGIDLLDRNNWKKKKCKNFDPLFTEGSGLVTEADALDDIFNECKEPLVVLTKELRSSSQAPVKVVKKQLVDNNRKPGQAGKSRKKIEKEEKEKELIKNLKERFGSERKIK